MNRIWTGGGGAYRQALREEHRVAVERLRSQLQVAQTEAERQDIEQQIVRLAEAHRQKLRTIPGSLF